MKNIMLLITILGRNLSRGCKYIVTTMNTPRLYGNSVVAVKGAFSGQTISCALPLRPLFSHRCDRVFPRKQEHLPADQPASLPALTMVLSGFYASLHEGKGLFTRRHPQTAYIGKCHGFTLIELMVSTAVFMLLVIVLASTLNSSLGVWSRNENKSDLRESARVAIQFMASELRQAALPVYRGDQLGLQMVINPSTVSIACRNHDAIFWQAPIATTTSRGNLAIVGYFVRKDGNAYKLCRLFVNPDDPAYALYSSPAAWVTDSVLSAKAPATDASNFQGVFLENVPGMWVTAYSDATTAYAPYDSRETLNAQNVKEAKFPARIEISLALLDKAGAERVARGQIALPDSSSATYPTLSAYIAALPASIRPNVQTVTISVSGLF